MDLIANGTILASPTLGVIWSPNPVLHDLPCEIIAFRRCQSFSNDFVHGDDENACRRIAFHRPMRQSSSKFPSVGVEGSMSEVDVGDNIQKGENYYM